MALPQAVAAAARLLLRCQQHPRGAQLAPAGRQRAFPLPPAAPAAPLQGWMPAQCCPAAAWIPLRQPWEELQRLPHPTRPRPRIARKAPLQAAPRPPTLLPLLCSSLWPWLSASSSCLSCRRSTFAWSASPAGCSRADGEGRRPSTRCLGRRTGPTKHGPPESGGCKSLPADTAVCSMRLAADPA